MGRLDNMNRERHTTPRRQFIHPLSPLRDTSPVASPETPKRPPQPVIEQQGRPAQRGTYPGAANRKPVDAGSSFIPVVEPISLAWTPPENKEPTTDPFATTIGGQGGLAQRNMSPGMAGNQVRPSSTRPSPVKDQTNGRFTPRVEPLSLVWMPPESEELSSDLFTPEPWAIPQTEESSATWQGWVYEEEQSETGKGAALAQEASHAPGGRARLRGRRGVPKQIQAQIPQKARKKRLPQWLVVVSVIAVIAVVLTQGNGTVGAWAADAFRTVAGPVAAAQVEAWYLNAQNTVYKWEYQLGLKHVKAPFQQTQMAMQATPPAKATLKAMPLASMQPFITPALDGEGVWSTLEAAPGAYSYLPLDARAFIRPDPATPYAVVSLLKFDARFMRMHIVAGTQEPGGPLNQFGTGSIAQEDQQGNALLATLNGGFKYADGAYGLMTDGKVYVPPQQNAGTLAIMKDGSLHIGAWGTDPLLNSNNKNLMAWRQNAALLIDNGMISTLAKDGAAWGGTILNSLYTWRSGLGITAEGDLIYAGGNGLLPETLGKALKAAGAVMGMETDINPFWVRAFLYEQDKGGAYTITKLNPDMQGTGNEYQNGNQRDFFYLTRYTPSTTPTGTNGKKG